MARKATFCETGGWYKGNTHLHTTLSDGKLDPEEAAAVYREAGYAFVAVTDHWVYGNHRELESEDFLLFAGMEMDVELPPEQGFCHHVTVMADPDETPYKAGETLADVRALGDMNAMVARMNDSGHLCIYAHPRWSHVKMEAYERVDGCAGVEIYNHIAEVDSGCGHAEAYYDRRLWEKQPCFCFACDDAHTRHHYLGGFIGVKAAALTHKAILDAIRAGSFYASTGPEIRDFYVEDGCAHVACSPCSDIAFFNNVNPGRRVVRAQPGTTRASCALPAGAAVVYAVCRAGDGTAWTQPIWL